MIRKTIYCTVSNDLNHDQRMHRICGTLAGAGFEVCLIGRKRPNSKVLEAQNYKQTRLTCIFNKGPFFYLEYNIRLFIFLYFHTPDIVYSVDTDTLLACTLIKSLKNRRLIFDSHEYFTEVPELQNRPFTKKIWSWIEKTCIPKTNVAITVNESLAKILGNLYNKSFTAIYNVPAKSIALPYDAPATPYIIYQGALNQGRGIEAIIEAMQYIPDTNLIIAGEGDLSDQLRNLAKNSPAAQHIIFTGWQSPAQLKSLTQNATLGVNLLEKNSLNYYYSLANKFFDYMHAGVPSINMDFPEYNHILNLYDVGYTVSDLNPESLSTKINNIFQDVTSYKNKQVNCVKASEVYQWEKESIKLLEVIPL
jgi:glycosyltransferase involved in cell wall biosynthesis